MEKSVSRRNFFKAGLGVAGTLAATHSLAQVCGVTTGEQPLGPFFPHRGTPEDPIRENNNLPIYLANDNDLTFIKGRMGTARGQVVYITGQVTDKNCNPVPNATLIIWQASRSGRYNHKRDTDNRDFQHPQTGEIIKRVLDPSFQYWGKALTNENGEYLFKTIVPGFYPAQDGWYRPPHIHWLVQKGEFQFVTQTYFGGDKITDDEWIQELNGRDFLLQNPNLSNEQRDKLVVKFTDDPSGTITDGLVGQFDLTLMV